MVLKTNRVTVTNQSGKTVTKVVRKNEYIITCKFYINGETKSDAWIRLLALIGHKGFFGVLKNDDERNCYEVKECV
jgi:hypothetical protein